jgi:broad specificity phosphatase PhoE
MVNDTDFMSRRITPDPDVIVTELDDGEAVLLHLGSRKYFSLNATGLEIWRLLGERLTPEAIGVRLQSIYDITPERARSSVAALVAELLDAGLVRLED